MDTSDGSVHTTLRIPGKWRHLGELIERMPTGFRLTPAALILPDGAEIEFAPLPPDNQFAKIFRTSCRCQASPAELQIVDHYTVNIGLSGPGGSSAAALTMMQAGAAIVRAGGGGVFIDNSGLAHGGSPWIEMAEDGGPDALSFAFVNIVRGRQDVWTMGMHVLGLPDVLMRRIDADADDTAIVDVLRYLCRGEKPIGDGHVLADENGPRYQAQAVPSADFKADSPMHNPFGRLQLISIKDLTERN
jgi:hypothetical protein